MEGIADKRILICEDQPELATLLQTFLAMEDSHVVGVAPSGREAVVMALESHPDIILMDIEMPKMDGLTAAKIILDQYPACIIFLSGNADVDSYQEAFRTGAAGYIVKPYRRQYLMEQLRNIVASWQEH